MALPLTTFYFKWQPLTSTFSLLLLEMPRSDLIQTRSSQSTKGKDNNFHDFIWLKQQRNQFLFRIPFCLLFLFQQSIISVSLNCFSDACLDNVILKAFKFVNTKRKASIFSSIDDKGRCFSFDFTINILFNIFRATCVNTPWPTRTRTVQPTTEGAEVPEVEAVAPTRLRPHTQLPGRWQVTWAPLSKLSQSRPSALEESFLD